MFEAFSHTPRETRTHRQTWKRLFYRLQIHFRVSKFWSSENMFAYLPEPGSIINDSDAPQAMQPHDNGLAFKQTHIYMLNRLQRLHWPIDMVCRKEFNHNVSKSNY